MAVRCLAGRGGTDPSTEIRESSGSLQWGIESKLNLRLITALSLVALALWPP